MFNIFKLIILIIFISIVSFNCERDLTSSTDFSSVESITILNPKGGERYSVDESVNVQWETNNLNEELRIELIKDDQSVFAVNNIPNSGEYIFQIPGSIAPSKKYQLKIESVIHPEVFDINKTYFEIAPKIDGHWFYPNLTEDSGLEIDLELLSFINNSFIGNGTFHLRYISFGEITDYMMADTIGGILSYPDISFTMKESNNKEFNFVGKMITNNSIQGRIFGVVNNTYGNLNDSLTLIRQ
jgi:hypothetical protein